MTPTTYQEIRTWLQHYRVEPGTLTDAELVRCYKREARERVLRFRDVQIKELFCRGAKEHPENRFLVSLASAVVSATDDEFDLLRPAALSFIERFKL